MYSCFQKNTKSNHHSLGPIGAIWLRLLMTTVYNAYHAFNLAGTADFLASNECKSFAHFQDKRRKRQPFRQFCMMLADDMVGRLKVTAPSVLTQAAAVKKKCKQTMKMKLSSFKEQFCTINATLTSIFQSLSIAKKTEEWLTFLQEI